ncbi:hypothetical protein HMPREF9005_0315 [Actinomyces sp. oral taxon 178 str. F0338]|nr:hypothetical protein HMPREF9005_0315 [Actinomyces sp. oral taxon 178 str. F0338]
MTTGQGAPSTIRCIKTAWPRAVSWGRSSLGQGAPSTTRCIKT